MFGSLFGRVNSAEPTENDEIQSDQDSGASMLSLFSRCKDIGSHLKHGVDQLTSVAFADFDREHQRFIHEKHNKLTGAAVPPWVGCDDEEQLREKILALSHDERNVTRDPPPGAQFSFTFDESFPVAQAILIHDQRLEKLRFKLVPKTISEPVFWRNYFYRVELIKQSSDVARHTTQMHDEVAVPPSSLKEKSVSIKKPSSDDWESVQNDNTSSQQTKSPSLQATSASNSAKKETETTNNDFDETNKVLRETSEEPSSVFEKEGWEDEVRDELSNLQGLEEEFDAELAGLDLDDSDVPDDLDRQLEEMLGEK
eukprot:gene9176-1467_t